MGRYVLKRILWLIPVIIGVVTVLFVLSSLIPGDPAQIILGSTATEDQLAALRSEMGLNNPLIVRWFNYVMGFFTRLDFGRDYFTNMPVNVEVASHLPVTIELALYSTIFGIVVGVPLGIISALKQYTWIDSAILVISVFLLSVPNFWLAMMLIKWLAVDAKILPAFGMASPASWIMPVICAGVGGMAQNTRITRSSMLEVMRQDYIRTAYAKGQKPSVVVIKHMLRNALVPVITVVGSGIGNALGGNMALEIIFALPGLGNYVVSAITQRNYNAMIGGILAIAIMFTIINLIVDLLYVAADPRLKTQMTGKKTSRRQTKRLLAEQGVTNA